MTEIHSTWTLSRRSMFGLGAAAVAAVGLAACSSSDDKSSGSKTSAANDVKSVATDAYVFGYPLVLMDATKTAGAPVNSFDHGVPPNPNDRDVVRLNLDTLYSQAWLDLSAEPMVLQVPAMDAGRYWLMQIMDAWSNTAHDPSSVKPQVKDGVTAPPYTYVLTGPGWSGTLPPNTTELKMTTPTVWIIGRIQINGAADLPNVQALQQQLKLVPLSRWAAGDEGGTVSRQHTTDAGAVPPVKAVAAMDGKTFYNKMCALMAVNPPAPADAAVMKRFATIGIKPAAQCRHPLDR
ncbi:DUF1254 domain-containing protein [Nocardia sp. SYP-A9097]|uniref:DUF1254 domain-containing protein n=1 Tax=Nocardia sp. SYP-A9097 TaxID=2663237 RepID=UPI001E463E1C|nr:DUF1254 domain-containing protein [Nocardia sp. SYP-A9097]